MANVDTQLEEAKRVTARVCGELRNAQLVWAHFEALNGEHETARDQLADGAYRLGLGNALYA